MAISSGYIPGRAKKWKQLKWASTDEWINIMQSIYPMEYDSTMKRNGVLIHATAWMNAVYPSNGIQFNHEQEQRSDPCYNMDES